MLNMDSLIFNEDALGEIVKKALLEEKIPHGTTPSSIGQQVTIATNEKRASGKGSGMFISVDSVLPDWILFKDCPVHVPVQTSTTKHQLKPAQSHSAAQTSSSPKDDKVSNICEYSQELSADVSRIATEKRELDAMIASLVEANQCFTEFPRQNEPCKDILLQQQNGYLEKKKCEESRSGEKERMRSRVLEISVRYIEMRIKEAVRFAKKIPGFLELPLEDQANLIRESRTESGIIGGMRGINTDKHVFASMQGDFFSLEDMKLVFEENLLKQMEQLSRKIALLHMSLEEEAILRAMTITATDRCPLQRKDIVEDIHHKLLTCLLYVIKEKGEGQVARRLGKLFDILVCCRDVTEVDMKQVKKILLEWPPFSSYKLVGEFL